MDKIPECVASRRHVNRQQASPIITDVDLYNSLLVSYLSPIIGKFARNARTRRYVALFLLKYLTADYDDTAEQHQAGKNPDKLIDRFHAKPPLCED